MKPLKSLASVCVVFLLTSPLWAQLTPFGLTTVSSKPWDTRSIVVPPNTSSSTTQFVVDPSAAGGDFFDVVVDNGSVLISLIVPGGTQVNASNASSLGYGFSVFTIVPVALPIPFAFPGTHTMISLPNGATAGTYTIKADSTSTAVQSLLIGSYYSSSSVTAGLTTDASNYKIGDLVKLSGLLFDANGPITNATVTASIAVPVDLSAQVNIGNYQLVSQQPVDGSTTNYTYTARATNTGSAIQGVSADATSSSANFTVLSGGLFFGDLAAGGSSTSSNTFVIQAPSSPAPDLSGLQWTPQMPGVPATVTLTDSGTFDAAHGDGVFSGGFTATTPGDYVVSMLATGTSSSSVSFSRTAVTDFTVVPATASLTSVSDHSVDTDGNGLTDQILVTGTLTVQKAGSYFFSVTLQASNGQAVQSSNTVALGTGSQTISVQFASTDIFQLGVSGPYERTQVYVALVNGDKQTVAALQADGGPTAAYTLASLDRGPVFFTGQNSAAGVITGAGPTFDLLRVTMGLQLSVGQPCDWSAVLADLSGNTIVFSAASAFLQAGANSITLDFNGNLIAQSVNGPYLIKDAAVHCGTDDATADTLFQTQAFTKSQFTFVAPDFNLSLVSSPPSAGQGSIFLFDIAANATATFTGDINFGVTGLPTGASGVFSVPTVPVLGATTLMLSTSSHTPVGTYPLTITGTSGALSHSVAATLTVTVATTTATPTFIPQAGTYTSPQNITINCATSGAVIHYTTNGVDPTSSSPTFSSAIPVNSTTTIKAIAIASGLANSAVASATYTINLTSTYTYHRAITLKHVQVPNTDQTNFPVLFNTTDPLLKTVANGGHVMNSSGFDIIFTSDAAGQNKLDHEIESYNPATGQFTAWIRIPSLSHATDTVIYLFYGNSGVTTSQENKTGVWDASYKGVWHLSEISGQHKDATSNVNNTTSVNAFTQGSAGGIADGADEMRTTANMAAVGTRASLTLAQSPFTLSAWVKGIAFGSTAHTVIWDAATQQQDVVLSVTNDKVKLGYGSANLAGATSISNDVWHYLAATCTDRSGGNGTCQVYLDGVLDGSANTSSLATATEQNVYLGGDPFFGQYLNGTLDEARISVGVARSADWLKTEYNNLFSPSTFFSLGAESGGSPGTPLQFVPITPCRIVDTRGAAGTFGGPSLAGGATRSIPIQSSACAIPASAKAYSFNATVVPKAGTLGYLTLFPTGQSQPGVSTLNSPDGSVIANAAIVPAGTSGSVDVFALQNTDFILDINGYFTTPDTNTLAFYPLTPCRAVDTRNAPGTFGGPFITGNNSRAFPLKTSTCGIPASAQAYSLNVTVVPHGFLGFLTAWPTGQTQPTASTLNSLDGTVLANAAIVSAGSPNGSVSFFASNDTDVIVDVNGYFAPPGTGGLNFYTVNPCRMVDNRGATGTFGGPIMGANTTRTYPLPSSSCGLPATAGAYSLNVTVQPSGFLGYATVWPTGQTQPIASTLNDPKELVMANAALVAAGTSGAVNVYVLNDAYVIIDVNGWFGQ
jgi:hypothetical protein